MRGESNCAVNKRRQNQTLAPFASPPLSWMHPADQNALRYRHRFPMIHGPVFFLMKRWAKRTALDVSLAGNARKDFIAPNSPASQGGTMSDAQFTLHEAMQIVLTEQPLAVGALSNTHQLHR